MKAIRIHGFGDSSKLTIEEVPQPRVTPGHVLVKIHDAGVNPIDWKIREGYLKDRAPHSFPLTMGRDFSGEIIEVGPEVTRFHKGDLVFGFAHGAYAEFASVGQEMIAHMPESLDFAAAASIPTAGLTAWQIVNDVLRAEKGQKILIHGAAGGVGSFAVQIARSRGASLTATAAESDRPYLEQLGVEKVIDYKTQRFEELVGNLDAVVDLVGGDTLSKSYQLVKKGGTVVTTVGPLDQNSCAARGISGVQFLMKTNAGELEELARLVERKVITPRVSGILPFSDAKKAQDLNQSGQSHGKLVLEVIREQLEPVH